MLTALGIVFVWLVAAAVVGYLSGSCMAFGAGERERP